MAHDDLGVEAAYTPVFRTALEQGGSWAREARLAVALAAQLCWTLNEDALIFGDVREVQALSERLRHLIEKKRRRVRARFPHSAILRMESNQR